MLKITQTGKKENNVNRGYTAICNPKIKHKLA